MLRARRIVKVRRTVVPKQEAGAVQENKPNPFAAISTASAPAADDTGTDKKPNSSAPISAANVKASDAAAAENGTPDAAVAPAEPANAGNKPPAMSAPVNGQSAPEKEPQEKEAEAQPNEETPKAKEVEEAAAPRLPSNRRQRMRQQKNPLPLRQAKRKLTRRRLLKRAMQPQQRTIPRRMGLLQMTGSQKRRQQRQAMVLCRRKRRMLLVQTLQAKVR